MCYQALDHMMTTAITALQVDLCTESALFRAAVPSGASTGIYEAVNQRLTTQRVWSFDEDVW